MAGSSRQPAEGEEVTGADIADFELGGCGPESIGHFFRAIVQSVLLFGAKMWVMTTRMEWSMSSFQHRVAIWLTGFINSCR